MSTYIWLDSNYRHDPTNTTPSEYVVTNEQTNNWPITPRTVYPIGQPAELQPLDFLSVVSVAEVYVFYDGVITPPPFIKLNFYNLEYNDVNLINTIDDMNNVKFILRQQHDFGTGWVRYTCAMAQTMRLKRRGTFKISVWDQDNNVLNTGVAGRITCLFGIIPYHLAMANHLQARVI